MADGRIQIPTDFNDDPRIIRGGWETAALLALVTSELRRKVVLPDLDADILAARWRFPVAVVAPGLRAMVEQGVLVRSRVEWRRERGIEEVREGWTLPDLCSGGNGPTRTAKQTILNDPDTFRTLAKVREGSPTPHAWVEGAPVRGRSTPEGRTDLSVVQSSLPSVVGAQDHGDNQTKAVHGARQLVDKPVETARDGGQLALWPPVEGEDETILLGVLTHFGQAAVWKGINLTGALDYYRTKVKPALSDSFEGVEARVSALTRWDDWLRGEEELEGAGESNRLPKKNWRSSLRWAFRISQTRINEGKDT